MTHSSRPRVSAVSYLNTSPLVWGLLHGPQAGEFDLRFELPAVCAQSLRNGTVEIGLVPCIEAARQGLESVPGLGIASDGPVRSILLVSKVPVEQIRSVAMDSSSRTSVVLTRIILARRYGVESPAVTVAAPEWREMLETADAALIIGDPALRFAPEECPYHVLDLGAEWTQLTGLPMVYAQWAGRIPPEAPAIFAGSYEYGSAHLDEILAVEARPRGVSDALATAYLTRHIVYRLDERHARGLAAYLGFARELNLL